MTGKLPLALTMACMYFIGSFLPSPDAHDHNGQTVRLALIHNVGHHTHRVRFRSDDERGEHVFTVGAGQKLLTQSYWEGQTLVSVDRGRRGRLRDVASLQRVPDIPGQIWVLEVRGGW